MSFNPVTFSARLRPSVRLRTAIIAPGDERLSPMPHEYVTVEGTTFIHSPEPANCTWTPEIAIPSRPPPRQHEKIAISAIFVGAENVNVNVPFAMAYVFAM